MHCWNLDCDSLQTVAFMGWFATCAIEHQNYWPESLPGFWSCFFRLFQRLYSQSSKQTVQGKQWKGTNEQLSPVALVQSTAPNQEAAVDGPASPPPPNPLPEPYPGVGNFGFEFWVRILGSIFLKMCDSAVWRLLQNFAPRIRTFIWKIRAKIRTKNSATRISTTKSPSNSAAKILSKPPRQYLQSPTASFQKVTRGAPLRSRFLLLPRERHQNKQLKLKTRHVTPAGMLDLTEKCCS